MLRIYYVVLNELPAKARLLSGAYTITFENRVSIQPSSRIEEDCLVTRQR
jgi:hypothetical protein